MFKANFRQIAVALVGAILFSTACIGAAIGPVQAAAPAAAGDIDR